jgi:hypothetical protein
MIFKWIKKTRYILGIISVTALAIVYTSCNITDPTKNIAVIFNTLSINTNISVNLVDAATGVSIGSTSQAVTVNLAFSGPGAAHIVSSLDEPITSLSINRGIGTFGVSSSFTPSTQNPVMATIQASSSGYQTTSYPINIQSTGSSVFTIRMVKISAPPAGASTAPSTPVPTSSGGTTTSTTTTTTGTEPTSGGSAGLTITTGTTIKDASGKPVTGNLTANVTYISGTNNTSNGSLPTGLSVGVTDNGQTTQGYIQPAAFASFTVSNQSGQLAKNFDPAISLSFTVSGTTINPITGVAIKDGDTVPIYSFNDATQDWTFETNSTAVSNGSGDFTLSFQASHLSFWLSGWILSGGKVCTNTITLNITGGFSTLLLKLKAGGQTILEQNAGSGSYTFRNLTLPKSVPVTIEAYSLLDCPPSLVGSTTVNDLCATNTVSLNASNSSYVNVDVDVTAICPHKSPVLEVKPSGYDIWIISPCGNIDLGSISNGHITLGGLKMGSSYTFGMVYKNTLYTQDHTVDATSYNFNYNISDSVCNADFK